MTDPTDDELDYVDEVATFFADEGMPLIAGRVIGWLLISDPPEQSAADLARVLGVSRGTAYTYLSQGRVPGYRLGSSWMVLRDEVRDFIAASSNQVQGRAERTSRD